jgi:2-amino-4-hydroxy-6-hydroxymethyldihydropteridine diphosphokinase
MPEHQPGRAGGRARARPHRMAYFLSLGSNMGNASRNLERARRLLERGGVEVFKVSSVYRTEPVDLADQPWFFNQVVEIRTDLGPRELLAMVKSIEVKMKRALSVPKGPRKIDIDILLAGKTVLETPGLTIPHPRLALRNFVLVPLREIAPRAVHPVLRKTVRVLAGESPDHSAVFRAGLVPPSLMPPSTRRPI